MIILKTLFYAYTAYYAIRELMWIFQTKANIERNQELRAAIKEFGDRKKEEKANPQVKKEKTAEEKEAEAKILWAFFTQCPLILWMVFGVFTFNWVPFLFFWLTQFVIGLITWPVKNYAMPVGSDLKGKAYIVLAWVNSVWGFAFCIFIIINAYHLHIDYSPLVSNLFK